MIATRALVEASISAINLGPESRDRLVDALTQLIDDEVALIVRERHITRAEQIEGGKPDTPTSPEQRPKSKPGTRKSSS